MNPRAAELIRVLGLAPHPEGGFYRETFRSTRKVRSEGRPQRDALTSIYFLLTAGGFSAWHRVRSDEVWNWHEGEALELLLAAPDFSIVQRRVLGQVGLAREPAATAPSGWWQAARPAGTHALCSCTVAPGFQFEDFSFLRDDPRAVDALAIAAPDLLTLL